MTRKDYVKIARVIRESSDATGYMEAYEDLARRHAVELKSDNPRFDTVRFLLACGMVTA